MGIPLSVLDPCSEDVDPYLLEHQHPRFRCKLPVELLVTITEFLLGRLCYRTAANLNVTCKIIHAETSSALYAAVVWRYQHFEAVANNTSVAAYWFKRQNRASPYKHVRYVCPDTYLGLSKLICLSDSKLSDHRECPRAKSCVACRNQPCLVHSIPVSFPLPEHQDGHLQIQLRSYETATSSIVNRDRPINQALSCDCFSRSQIRHDTPLCETEGFIALLASLLGDAEGYDVWRIHL
jgi:hypothetical protein